MHPTTWCTVPNVKTHKTFAPRKLLKKRYNCQFCHFSKHQWSFDGLKNMFSIFLSLKPFASYVKEAKCERILKLLYSSIDCFSCLCCFFLSCYKKLDLMFAYFQFFQDTLTNNQCAIDTPNSQQQKKMSEKQLQSLLLLPSLTFVFVKK